MAYSIKNQDWNTPSEDHIEFDDSSFEMKIKTTISNQQIYSGDSEYMILKIEAKSKIAGEVL